MEEFLMISEIIINGMLFALDYYVANWLLPGSWLT
jgi:hypothetical protein